MRLRLRALRVAGDWEAASKAVGSVEEDSVAAGWEAETTVAEIEAVGQLVGGEKSVDMMVEGGMEEAAVVVVVQAVGTEAVAARAESWEGGASAVGEEAAAPPQAKRGVGLVGVRRAVAVMAVDLLVVAIAEVAMMAEAKGWGKSAAVMGGLELAVAEMAAVGVAKAASLADSPEAQSAPP